MHARYQQRGGEDAVFDDELELLRAHGHSVETFVRDNAQAQGRAGLRLAIDTVWAAEPARALTQAIAQHQPDLVHAHNSFPLISPSIVWAAARAGVPFVQTLHNYRLLCPQGMLMRAGQACEDCVGRLPLPALRHACYRGSRPASAAVVSMLLAHRALGTWRHKVARFIALSEFSRGRFIAGGLPAERIEVKPNFAPDPVADGLLPSAAERDPVLLFVGRLAPEKGLSMLARLARSMPTLRIRVLGEGPDAHLLDGLPNVDRLGVQPPERVRTEMLRARALLLPSTVYENFPRSLVEAAAAGLPALVSDQGALRELVGAIAPAAEIGWRIAPGDLPGWQAAAAQAVAEDASAVQQLADAARARYLAQWTPARAHDRLQAVYQSAMRAADPA